jgi:hypothetical protein
LLEVVRFELVSSGSMNLLFDLISDSFEYFTISLWTRLRNRLVLDVHLDPSMSRFALSCQFGRALIMFMMHIHLLLGLFHFSRINQMEMSMTEELLLSLRALSDAVNRSLLLI